MAILYRIYVFINKFINKCLTGLGIEYMNVLMHAFKNLYVIIAND